MQHHEGQKVPQVTFKARSQDKWLELTTDHLFKGKRVVVFSLPGAFTPTCSSSHVPRYNELAPIFKENGIDDVLCVSVNDGFVMEAWQKDQAAWNLTFVPDGNGEFSQGMGMLVDKDNLGFGKRSWRYSMLVNDGVVEKMFVEREVEGDPFEVSDADTMLNFVNPKANQPKAIALFTRPGCPFCTRAKEMLTQRNLPYEEIVLGRDISMSSVRAVSGNLTVPQVFVDGKLIGGSDDLASFLNR